MGDGELFGDLLRRHRLAAGLTQEDLAERAGLSVRGISDLERGARTAPRRETLRMLADALGLAGRERAVLVESARGARPHDGPERASPRPDLELWLPAPLDSFVDRVTELAALDALLRTPGIRLVTLIGLGGAGKTRLALAAAASVVDAFPGGVGFLDLAPVSDPALVLPTLARGLRVREAPGQSPRDGLAAAFGRRPLLLVLDNLEQVAAAAPEIAALLAACPALVVLATSRVPLRLAGERRFPVPPLPVPAEPGPADDAPAVRLFVERARQVDPVFAPAPADAAAVAALCRRLDGIPLAIELAAARVAVLPPAAMLRRLERHLPVLADGVREPAGRRRTVADAIAWSHDLLPPPARALFRRLAVFAGGFTLDQADAVGADLAASADAMSTLDAVSLLVEASLVRAATVGGDGEPRFAMLETIREDALARLAAADEEAVARDRHAAAFLALVEAAELGLERDDQARWLPRLDAEIDNLRVAIDWAATTGRPETAVRLARSLWRYWSTRGRPGEGRGFLERALSLPGADALPAELRAEAANALGNLASDLGDLAAAANGYAEALARFREIGREAAAAVTLNNLGLLALWCGRYAEATDLLEESVAVQRRIGRPSTLALPLTNLGDVALAHGDLARARALHAEGLALRERDGNAIGVAYSRYSLGEVARVAGEANEARGWLRASLGDFAALGDRPGIAYAEWSLGRLAASEGRWVEAARHLEAALTIRVEANDPRGIAECLEAVGVLGVRVGRAALGRAILLTAAAARVDLGTMGTAADRGEVAAALVGADSAADPPLAPRRAIEEALVLLRALAAGEPGGDDDPAASA